MNMKLTNRKFVKDEIEAGRILNGVICYALRIGNHEIFEICKRVPDLIRIHDSERKMTERPEYGWGHYEVIGNK